MDDKSLSARWQELFWALPTGEMRSKLRSLECDSGTALRELAQVKAENERLDMSSAVLGRLLVEEISQTARVTHVAERLRKERADLAAVAESLKAENDVLELVIKDEREELRHHIDEIVKVKAENERLKAALSVVRTTTRVDEKSECWAIRKYLDDNGIYNDDVSSRRRLVAMACTHALKPLPEASIT